MAVTYRFTHRRGKMRCCKCKSEFVVQPGAHPHAACPRCNSLYYEWLDYEEFDIGERTARGAASVGSGQEGARAPFGIETSAFRR